MQAVITHDDESNRKEGKSQRFIEITLRQILSMVLIDLSHAPMQEFRNGNVDMTRLERLKILVVLVHAILGSFFCLVVNINTKERATYY